MAKNITCVTHLSCCKGIGGLRSSLIYAGSKNKKPHNHAKLRVANVTAWNLPNNTKLAYRFMKTTLKNAGIIHNNNRIMCLRDVQSFNLKPNRHNLAIATKIHNVYIKRAYPHQEVISFAHFDTSHLHFHSICLPLRYDTLKIPKRKWNWWTQSRIMDNTLRHFGYNPMNNGKLREPLINSSRGFRYYSNRGKSYVFKVLKAVNYAKKHATNLNNFSKILNNKYSIQVEMFKHATIKGHRQLKYYHFPSDNGDFKKLTSGLFLRYKKHLSFKLKPNNNDKLNGEPIIIREKKLGRAFAKPVLLAQFKRNRQRLQQTSYHIPVIHSHNKHIHNTLKISHNINPHINLNKILHINNFISKLRHRVRTDSAVMPKPFQNDKDKKRLQRAERINNIDTDIGINKNNIENAKELRKIEIKKIRKNRGMER